MSIAARLASSACIALALPVIACAHADKTTGQDYRGFERNDGQGSCCDWQDCRPAYAPVMEEDGEKISDRANNKFAFDPNKVVKRPSDDGNWHICGDGTRIKCIIAPAEALRGPLPWDTRFSFLAMNNGDSSGAALQGSRILIWKRIRTTQRLVQP
jgi:hypothetical protein